MKRFLSESQRWWLPLACLLFLFAGAKGVFQDTQRFPYPINDLLTPWVSSRAFAEGINPYVYTPGMAKVWSSTHIELSGGCTDYPCVLQHFPDAYPPTTLVLLLPISFLSWPLAVAANMVISLGILLLGLLLLAQNLGSRAFPGKGLYLIAFGLAMAPTHSGIHQSNVVTATVGAICIGMALLEKRPYLAGCALAVGLCLKPQVAVLFFLYPVLRRKWAALAAGIAVYLTILGGSILWLGMHGIHWVPGYLAALTQFSAPDASSSFFAPGPGKYQLLNLDVLAYQLLHNVRLSVIVSWMVFGVLAIAGGRRMISRSAGGSESSRIAMVAILTLLPVYQRFYTGTVLILVLYWALEQWPSGRAKIAHLLLLPLLLPLATMTKEVGVAARFISRHDLGTNPIWNSVFMPHVIWIELILFALCLTSTVKPGGGESEDAAG